MKRITQILIALALASSVALAEKKLPVGLMLNLDFQNVQDGLIPNKSLYPLHVPKGELGMEWANHRYMLAIQSGQGLSIPHSSLLDPDGSEWVVTVRAFVLTDGLVLSQGNDEHGYAIYIKDHTVQATVRTSHIAMTLQEGTYLGINKYRNQWVTIELRIKKDKAYLLLNRKMVAKLDLDAPLKGENMHIRIGNHQALPTVLKNKPGSTTTGFTGAISSLKVIRQ
ncbi:hypothetical protein PDESU_04178 [Pontiella desulfatans]|uniref:Uncharacterized protein n=1 Tax=Pontiella desulfatans TaxID=2750659 RepID=A0A6C2U6R7_PONDE|nr:hypothetical protein [Pontiella desulfatans]VGO15593.1 hypothetical protein PDESU_04178 [Pontiella desulfatans]